MIRNLKALGLALVAVFAMSAMAASAASADEFTAETYPATLTGAHDPDPGTPVDKFGTTSGNVSCPDATYHGTIAGPTTTVLITPSFNGPKDTCTAFGLPAVVHTNGCHFLFHVLGGASTEGTVDLTCPGAIKDITVTAGQNTAGSLTTKCTVHVPEQTGINGIKYTTRGAGTTREVTIDINSTNITYTHTSGTGLGACVGGGATHQNNGTFTGFEVLTGEVDPPPGAHIGIFLSNLP